MSYDLTNQFISNTFGNLLQQTGSEGHLYDLKGNRVNGLKDEKDIFKKIGMQFIILEERR